MVQDADPVSFQLCKTVAHTEAEVGTANLNLKEMKSLDGSTSRPSSVKDAVSHLQHMISEQAVMLNTMLEIHQAIVNTLADLGPLDLVVSEATGSAQGIARSRSPKSPTHNLVKPPAEIKEVDLMLDVFESAPSNHHVLSESEISEENVRYNVVYRVIKMFEWFVALKEPPRSGFLHSIVMSGWFHLASTLSIVFNAMTIAYYADYDMKQAVRYGSRYNQSDYRWYVGLFFVSVYLIEVGLKILVHRVYFFVGKDMGWNIFDFALILLGLLDAIMQKLPNVWSISNANFMRLLRLLKVIRTLRTIRVLKFFHELRVMLLALLQSTMSLFWCMVMIFFIMYMFGLVFIQGANNWIIDHEIVDPDPYLKQKIHEKFDSLAETMLTLYQSVTGGQDWGPIYRMTEKMGIAYGVLYLFFTIFFMFAVVNIVTAIYVDNVQKNAQPDQDDILDAWRREHKLQRETMRSLVNSLDRDQSGSISKTEFAMLPDNEHMLALLETLGIKLKDVEMLFQLMEHHALIAGRAEVDSEAFVEGLLKLNGRASAVDIHVLSFQVKLVHQASKKLEKTIFHALHKITDGLHKSSVELSLVRSAMPTARTSNLQTASTPNLPTSWRLPEVPTERSEDPLDKHTADAKHYLQACAS